MAEVLPIPREADDQPYYSGSPLKRSSRSYSSLLPGSTNSHEPSQPSPPIYSSRATDRPSRSLPPSIISSASQSLTDLSSAPSIAWTPATSVSFDIEYGNEDLDDLAFPSYDDGVKFYHQDEALDLPSDDGSEDTDSQDRENNSTTTDSTISDSPVPTPSVADDTAVKPEPSRHVDYLSHDWREEDIWSSWRHIVSQRRVYGQRSRLENASWRTWAKSKNHLPTISPETLNWLKESDVTWLYGPLQPAATHPLTHSSHSSPRHTSSMSPGPARKPILKKRSMSEVMLQRSISASSLIKQAAASVQAQQHLSVPRPGIGRTASDFVPSNGPSGPISRDQLDYFTPKITSRGSDTPSDTTKRHIRFDDKVEQCIAVDSKREEQDSDSEPEDDKDGADDSESDSDDGVVMMRRARPRRPTMAHRKDVSRSHTPTRQIIEKLPDTTLKYRKSSDEVAKQQPATPLGRSWGCSTKLNQSPSAETLRPSNPSRNFILPEYSSSSGDEVNKADSDEDDQNADSDMSWRPSNAYANRRDSVAVTRSRTAESGCSNSSSSVSKSSSSRQVTNSFNHYDDSDFTPEPSSGLRRTPSGMFMPYEEDEDDLVATELGLFGRVSETINTAKDIAHVIWNVGWRT